MFFSNRMCVNPVISNIFCSSKVKIVVQVLSKFARLCASVEGLEVFLPAERKRCQTKYLREASKWNDFEFPKCVSPVSLANCKFASLPEIDTREFQK